MPELPEVETIKNELSPYVVGRKFTGATLLWERIVRAPSAEEFRSRLVGQEICRLSRHGKYLVLHLSNDNALVIHLKMTGSLLLSKDSSAPPRYTRAVLHLDGGMNILFLDPRKFGGLWLVKDRRTVTRNLGPEPLEPDFTPQLLAQRLQNRKAPVKALLCDQSIIAGIGNMYADEALFAAKIHPLRSAATLTVEEIERLHCAIQQTLRTAIGNKGASIANYYRPSGETGTAHFEFKVAHGSGKTCPVCGTPIQRIAVRNRGTYFCPECQPPP